MTTQTTGKSAQTYGRIAGLSYLIIIACGLFSEMFVRGGLIVPGNAAETASNIASAQGLFRAGFFSDLIMVSCDIAVAVIFFHLLKPVSKSLATWAMVTRLIQSSIIAMNLLNHLAALLVLDGNSVMTAFSAEQQNAFVMFFLKMHETGYLISGVFFGMSCLILGFLFYKSASFPKFLGVLLLLAGAGYLIDCSVNFLMPEMAEHTEMLVVATAVPTEFALCIWLLVKGAKRNSIAAA